MGNERGAVRVRWHEDSQCFWHCHLRCESSRARRPCHCKALRIELGRKEVPLSNGPDQNSNKEPRLESARIGHFKGDEERENTIRLASSESDDLS